jgi:hypothetical protein
VDGVFGVREEQIMHAIKLGTEGRGAETERTAAVGLADVLFSEDFTTCMAILRPGARVGVILTGGDIEDNDVINLVPDLAAEYLAARGNPRVLW